MKNITRLTLKYFWKHAKRYKILIALMLVFLPIGLIGGDIFVPVYYKQLIDLISNFVGQSREVIWPEIIYIFVTIGILFIISFLAWRVFEFAIIKFEVTVLRNMERDVYKKLRTHSFSFFANNFTGALVNKSGRLVRAFEGIADNFLFDLYSNIVRFTASVVVIFWFIPVMAWLLIGWSIFYLGSIYLFSIWKFKYDAKNAAADSRVTAELADGITNITAMKSFSHASFEDKRFWDATRKRFLIRKFCWNLDHVARMIQAVLMIILEVGVIFMSVRLWILGQISVGTIVLIHIYLGAILKNLWNFGRVIKSIHEAFARSREMIQIIYKKPEVLDIKNPQKCEISQGKIEFKNIDFGYRQKKGVFNNFNLKIKAGEKVGLVGESGSGKTTLTKLLFRFADVKGGKILIDGQDISRTRQEDLREQVAFVPQDPILFHRTLLENIQYGDLKASKEEIIVVAKKAYAHKFIQKCAQKYNTLVGERGTKLSGGEKQRIAIARAMLKDAHILVLDEATSSLDSKSEKLIQGALGKLMKNRTTIVIAHRLSTIQKMDRIIVLDHGKIVEEGSHEKLLKKKGKYAELWKHQIGGFLA
ncbi:MAG TPA: ABC transporter ATP-binding protein [Candidatus Peregrinibacteria bacterium]|nr:ABC transporter ATP-binding protein [Candidatus Peregrinibacteria bacterium]